MRERGVETTTILPLCADFNSELREGMLENMRDRVARLIGVHPS